MKKTVLIVEDNQDQRNMLKQLVLDASENTSIYLASNASAAYQILMEKPIDVFLVDIILDTSISGDTSGARLVEKFREIPKYMFTPVIFVTSLEDPTMYCYTDLNCIGYIEKPFDPKRIVKLVERALNYSTVREKECSMTFRRDGILYPVKLKDVVYMESMNHIMYIHFSNRSTLKIPYVTCKQILTDANNNCIIQCSRNVLINKNYVLHLDFVNRVIEFKEQLGRVDVGITYKKKVIMELKDGC